MTNSGLVEFARDLTREDQFDARIDGDRLVGRGASDMKGGLAAMIYATAAARERGLGVALMLVPHEETGGHLGAERLSALGLMDPNARGAIAAGPTWGTIWHAARGAYTVRVTVRGTPAHVGLHYQGVTAFEAAVSIVEQLRPLQKALRERRSALVFGSEDPRAAESIMLVGGVSSGGHELQHRPRRVLVHDRPTSQPGGRPRGGQSRTPRSPRRGPFEPDRR